MLKISNLDFRILTIFLYPIKPKKLYLISWDCSFKWTIINRCAGHLWWLFYWALSETGHQMQFWKKINQILTNEKPRKTVQGNAHLQTCFFLICKANMGSLLVWAGVQHVLFVWHGACLVWKICYNCLFRFLYCHMLRRKLCFFLTCWANIGSLLEGLWRVGKLFS